MSESRDPHVALREALKGDAAARALHRLHCVVLVASGRDFDEVAALFGDDARSIRRWVQRFAVEGAAGLADASRSGRPRVVPEEDIARILRSSPRDAGYDADAWSGTLLRREVTSRFGVTLSARQCQRLLAGLPSASVPAEA